MADVQTCAEVTDQRGKSSLAPCSPTWCTGTDFASWKWTALRNVRAALSRDDLDGQTRATLMQWDATVEAMPQPSFFVADSVNRLASIARQSACVALRKPDEVTPALQLPQENSLTNIFKNKNYWLAVAGVGALAFLAWKTGALDGVLKKKKASK
jgi:hypothetical protein